MQLIYKWCFLSSCHTKVPVANKHTYSIFFLICLTLNRGGGYSEFILNSNIYIKIFIQHIHPPSESFWSFCSCGCVCRSTAKRYVKKMIIF